MGSQIYLLLLILCFSCSVTLTTAGVKTCSSQLEYYFNLFGLSNGGSCQIDPDGGATPMEILQRWGCTVETNTLTTTDGYQILVIRAYKNLDPTLTPILMVHGIYMNSRAFVSSGEKSLVYQLIEQRRQVFLINLRGSLYSPGNVNGLDKSNYDYWNFTWHEMGMYDMPAALDLVYQTTQQKAIVIGYSMGTTVTSVFLSLNPEKAQSRVKNFVAMAPIVILNKQIRSILGGLAPLWPLVQPIAKLVYNGEMLTGHQGYTNFCIQLPITMQMCYSVVVPLYGSDYEGLDYAKRPIQLVDNPDSICEKVVTHYAQIIDKGLFQMFDYGASGNLLKYNSPTPPLYPLNNINVPVTYVVASNDYLAESSNAKTAFSQIPQENQCGFLTISQSKFAHDNFINHVDQLPLLNQPITDLINKLESNICPIETIL
ncbi:lipase member K-like [Diabrotica undecimpunctata]|uniref:lipase member K-like n=1 Tax=Diabrotica undecimpunctata TaxID=50387 RepID=UPI003B6365DD